MQPESQTTQPEASTPQEAEKPSQPDQPQPLSQPIQLKASTLETYRTVYDRSLPQAVEKRQTNPDEPIEISSMDLVDDWTSGIETCRPKNDQHAPYRTASPYFEPSRITRPKDGRPLTHALPQCARKVFEALISLRAMSLASDHERQGGCQPPNACGVGLVPEMGSGTVTMARLCIVSRQNRSASAVWHFS